MGVDGESDEHPVKWADVFDGRRTLGALDLASAVVLVPALVSYVLALWSGDARPPLNVGAAAAAIAVIPSVALLRCVRRSTGDNARAVGKWGGVVQQATTISVSVYLGLLLAVFVKTSEATATIAGILLVLQPVGSFFAGQRSSMTRAETEATLRSIREIQVSTQQTIQHVGEIQVSTQQTIQNVARIQTRSDAALASIRGLQVRALSGPLGLELLAIQAASNLQDGNGRLQRLVWLAGASALTDTRLCSCSLWARSSDTDPESPRRWAIAASSVPRPSDADFFFDPIAPGDDGVGAGILPNLYARVGRGEETWNDEVVHAWSAGDVFLAAFGAHRHPWFKTRPGARPDDPGATRSMAARLLRDPFKDVVVGAIVLTSSSPGVVPISPGPERDEMIDILDHWTHTFYWALHHYRGLLRQDLSSHA